MPLGISGSQQLVGTKPSMRTGALAVAAQDRQGTSPDFAVFIQTVPTAGITSVAEPTRSMSKDS